MREIKVAVADLLSNSYFPLIAAVELGLFAAAGYRAELELISPADAAYRALRDGAVHLVGAEAHAALAVFPNWSGVKLICAQSQGMYWFLVMRSDLGIRRGDLACVRGRKIAAAPWVELGLKRMLREAGIDPETDLAILRPAEIMRRTASTGVALARALEDGEIDGFWANGMGAEIAVRNGAGTVVLDVRRGDGPPGAFGYTFPAVAASDGALAGHPGLAVDACGAIDGAHRLLKEDPRRATLAARRLFPPLQADLIADVIGPDLPFYDSSLAVGTLSALNHFARDVGLLTGSVSCDRIVARH